MLLKCYYKANSCGTYSRTLYATLHLFEWKWEKDCHKRFVRSSKEREKNASETTHKVHCIILTPPTTTSLGKSAVPFMRDKVRSEVIFIVKLKSKSSDLCSSHGAFVFYCSGRYLLWQLTSRGPAGPRWPLRQPWSSCASPLDCLPGGDRQEKMQKERKEKNRNIRSANQD